MTKRPKYRAVRSFSVGGVHFEEGDLVPEGRALIVALEHGEKFVKADTARSRKQEAATAATPEPEE